MNKTLLRKIKCRLTFFVLPLMFFSLSASAALITVTNRLDSGTGSLRNAVSSSADGDSITFHSSIASDSIVLTSGPIVPGNKSLVILGPGANKLIISAAGKSRLFEVSSGYTLTIVALSLHSGKASSGNSGGAVLNLGNFQAYKCSFLANTSSKHGGAIYSEGMVYLFQSTFVYNRADSSGGALANVSGYVNIVSSTFSSNTAGKEGGAIYNLSISPVIPKIEITASTILFNAAGTRGGGIANTYLDYRDTVMVFLLSSIVADNVSGEKYGHDIYRNLSSRCYIVSRGYNLIGNSDSSGMYGTSGDIMGNTVSPIDPMLLPLGNYGGTTMTHSFRCNSPALDSGDPFLTVTEDQRGEPRKFNGIADMGAFESQIDLYPPPVYIGEDIDTCIGSQINLEAGRPVDSVNWIRMDRSLILANSKTLVFKSGRLDSIMAEVISPGKCPNYDTIVIKLVDVIKPVITACPSNLNVFAGTTSCRIPVNWTAPTASDNCNVDTFYSNYNPGDSFNTGATSVVYTAIDDAGNKTECRFTVTVKDQINPQIVCPGNIKMTAEQDKCYAAVSYSPPIGTDNCAGANTVKVKGLGPDTNFPAGITIEQWQVTDASGNRDSCEFTVEVEDKQIPEITCPNDIKVTTDSGLCHAVVTYQLVRKDNCPNDSLILISGFPSGSQFPKGTTTVSYRLQDIGGNWDTCSFLVVVEDKELPEIICTPLVESCTTYVTYNLPTFSDNCPGVNMTLVSGHGSGKIFPVGENPEIYQVEDASGNMASCTTRVVVYDAPSLDAGNDTTVYVGDAFYLNPKTEDTLDFHWTPADYLDDPDIKHPLCTPEKSITYTCYVETKQKCNATDSVKISVINDLFIPTVFTPGNADGRGTNDYWEIKGLQNYPDCIIRVYNLWGDLIFESVGYAQAWDGKSGEKELPTGSYYYIIKLNAEEKPKTGNLLIIR